MVNVKSFGILTVVGVVVVAVGSIIYMTGTTNVQEIESFEECVAAGYPVMESYPRQCRTPDGRTFVEELMRLDYNIGGCSKQEEGDYTRTRGVDEVDVEIFDGSINLIHHLKYVCCAEMKVYLDSLETYPEYVLVKIKERNEGEICRCICDYEVNMRLGPLEKGNYLIQILGVEYEDVQAELSWEGEVRID